MGGDFEMYGCLPVVCPPQYCVHDCYVPRIVPVIHPVVHVNRTVAVNVPQHFYQPIVRNVMVDPYAVNPGMARPQVADPPRFTGGKG